VAQELHAMEEITSRPRHIKFLAVRKKLKWKGKGVNPKFGLAKVQNSFRADCVDEERCPQKRAASKGKR